MKPNALTRSLLDDLRALPRPFWVLLIGTFINRFGTFVMPFLTIYLSKRGYSLITAGYAVSAFGFGTLCGSALGGWLADWIGRRNTIVIGTFASAIFYLLLHYTGTLPQILACTFFAGLSAGVYPPASSALLSDVVPEPLRVRAFSALRVALNAGFACGAATAGFLAKYSYFWLFAGDALTTTLYGFIALLALPHGVRATADRAPWNEAVLHIRQNKAFLVMFTASLMTALVFSQFGTTYSAHVVSLGLTLELGGFRLTGETLYGVLLGWNGFMVMTTELPLTSLTQRFDVRRVMALGYALLGLGFALNAYATSVAWLFGTMTIFTIGEMISMPVSSAYVARLSPERMRGRYMGVLSLSWSISSIVGPQIGFRLLGPHTHLLWAACGVLGVAGAFLLLRFSPDEDQITAAESSSTAAKEPLSALH